MDYRAEIDILLSEVEERLQRVRVILVQQDLVKRESHYSLDDCEMFISQEDLVERAFNTKGFDNE